MIQSLFTHLLFAEWKQSHAERLSSPFLISEEVTQLISDATWGFLKVALQHYPLGYVYSLRGCLHW